MSGQQPARVGDVIEHGQPIPGNVAELSDSSSTNGWGRWVRSVNGLWNWAPTADDVESAELRVGGCTEAVMTDLDSGCLPYRVEAVSYTRPLTVVEVDPEPQPAEPGLRDQLLSMWQEYATSSDVVDDAHLVRWVNALIENLGYASQRLKRSEASEGTVVQAARRWYYEHGFKPGYLPRNIHGSDRDLKLAVEQISPPREARVWPKIDGTDVLPDLVDVHVPDGPVERWKRNRGTDVYAHASEDRGFYSHADLRELGEVREVLDA